MAKVKLLVHVQARAGHKGVWAGGVHCAEGLTTVEVEQHRVADVIAKQAAKLLKIIAEGADVPAALEREAETQKKLAEVAERAAVNAKAAAVKVPAGVGPRGAVGSAPRAALSSSAAAELDRVQEDLQRQAADTQRKHQEMLDELDAEHSKLDEKAAQLQKSNDELSARAKALDEREAALKTAPITTPAETPAAKGKK